MNQAEYETLQTDLRQKIRNLNIKLGEELKVNLHICYEHEECNEFVYTVSLYRAVTDSNCYCTHVIKKIETYRFTKGATPERWKYTFDQIEALINELLPNEKKYYLYKELSDSSKNTIFYECDFDFDDENFSYERTKKAILARDRRIFLKNGSIADPYWDLDDEDIIPRTLSNFTSGHRLVSDLPE